jgi:hypothetical protein
MAIFVTEIRVHYTRHRGWSTHMTRRRFRQAQPNRKVNGISRTIRRPRHARDASTAQAENVFVAIRKAIDNRNAREGAAALPYAEILYPTGKQYSLQCRHEREGTASGDCVVSLNFETKLPHIAQRGGMWSGWAASRTGQLSDTASQHTFGGWQGGHPKGQRDFAYHPATSARTRCIHRASGERVCGHPKGYQ